MPAIITKNQQSSDRKSMGAVEKSVEKRTGNIERKTREMERILNEFPNPVRQKK